MFLINNKSSVKFLTVINVLIILFLIIMCIFSFLPEHDIDKHFSTGTLTFDFGLWKLNLKFDDPNNPLSITCFTSGVSLLGDFYFVFLTLTICLLIFSFILVCNSKDAQIKKFKISNIVSILAVVLSVIFTFFSISKFTIDANTKYPLNTSLIFCLKNSDSSSLDLNTIGIVCLIVNCLAITSLFCWTIYSLLLKKNKKI